MYYPKIPLFPEEIKEFSSSQFDIWCCFQNEKFTFLMCHGLLHLHGYDHLNEADEKEMFMIQDEIMDNIIKR